MIIDPYPNMIVRSNFRKLIMERVENIPLSTFNVLDESDILFIDTSHVIKTGNDVAYEYLKVLPTIKKGVFIHAHDIMLPYEYPKERLLKKHIFWNEQYLLQAFLTFNSAFKVIWASCFMHRNHSSKLAEAFKEYNATPLIPPGSFWFQRIC